MTEKTEQIVEKIIADVVRKVMSDTIDHCAQVVRDFDGSDFRSKRDIVAAILALKDKL